MGTIFPLAICRAPGLASKLTAHTHVAETVCAHHNFFSFSAVATFSDTYLLSCIQEVVPIFPTPARLFFFACFTYQYVCCLPPEMAGSVLFTHRSESESAIDSQLHSGLSLFVVDFGSARICKCTAEQINCMWSYFVFPKARRPSLPSNLT